MQAVICLNMENLNVTTLHSMQKRQIVMLPRPFSGLGHVTLHTNFGTSFVSTLKGVSLWPSNKKKNRIWFACFSDNKDEKCFCRTSRKKSGNVVKGLLWHSVAPKLLVSLNQVKDALKQSIFVCQNQTSEQWHRSVCPTNIGARLRKVSQFSGGYKSLKLIFSKSGRQNWIKFLQQTEE